MTKPLPKLTRIRMVVLTFRLLRVVAGVLVCNALFVAACWISGTSSKEVRRQLRLQELTGNRRR